MIGIQGPLAITAPTFFAVLLLFPACACAQNDLHEEDREFRLSRILAGLDPRVRRVQRELSSLHKLDATLPNPRIELRQSGANVKAALLSAKPGDSNEEPFIEFQFDEPQRVDTLYLAPAPAFFELIGERQRFSASRSTPGHFQIKLVAGGKNRLIAIGDPNADRQLPVRLPINADEVTSLQLGFGPLSKPHLHAYLSISEIFILSGERNIAPLASVRISDSLQAAEGWELEYATDERHWLGPPVIRTDVESIGYRSAPVEEGEAAWIDLVFPRPVAADEIRIFPAVDPNRPVASNYLFPRRLNVSGRIAGSSTQLVLLDWRLENSGEVGSSFLTARNRGSERFQVIRIEGRELQMEGGMRYMAIGEIQVIAGNENIAPQAEIRVNADLEGQHQRKNQLTDSQIGTGQIIPLADWLAGVNQSAVVQQDLRYLELRLDQMRERWRSISIMLVAFLIFLIALAFAFQIQRARRKRRLAEADLRKQLLMDLHDEFGGNLGVIALIAGQLKHEQGRENFAKLLDRKLDQVVEIVGASRQLLPRIVLATEATRPPLAESIEKVLGEYLDDCDVEFESDTFPRRARLDSEVEEAVFLIAKESIHNCAKHSNSTEVCARLGLENGGVHFDLVDNGSWKMSGHGNGNGNGIGLQSLQRRAKKVGGTLEINHIEGTGTTLKCFVPISSKNVSGGLQNPP